MGRFGLYVTMYFAIAGTLWSLLELSVPARGQSAWRAGCRGKGTSHRISWNLFFFSTEDRHSYHDLLLTAFPSPPFISFFSPSTPPQPIPPLSPTPPSAHPVIQRSSLHCHCHVFRYVSIQAVALLPLDTIHPFLTRSEPVALSPYCTASIALLSEAPPLVFTSATHSTASLY